MVDNLHAPEITGVKSTGDTSSDDRAVASERHRGMTGCGRGHKGLLLMAICCGAPLLLLLALPLLVPTLGGFSTSVLYVLALLACPIGMGVPLWMMRRDQQTVERQSPHQQAVSLPQMARTAPGASQDAAGFSDPSTTPTATAIPAPPAPAAVTSLATDNSHQQTVSAPMDRG